MKGFKNGLRNIRQPLSLVGGWLCWMCLRSPGDCYAQLSIGVKFVGGRHTTGPDGATVTGVAGVVAQGNWNNVAPWSATMNLGGGALPDADGSATNLFDSAGVATTLDLSWDSDNSYASINPSIDNQDEALMDGYIDVSSAQPRTTVSFSQIPFSTYDVYVYVGSDGNDRTAHVDINNDIATTIWFLTNTGGGRFSGPGSYRQATATSESTAQPGNYIVYPKIQGSTLDVAVNQGSFNAGIHAIQIVQSILPSKLMIDTRTGAAKIVGGDSVPIAMNSYEISSTAGTLLPQNLQGLAARGVDSIDGEFDADQIAGNSPGESWQAINVGSDQILEGFLLGSSVFDTAREEPLGRIYDPAFGEDSSLIFRYTLASGVTVDGTVEFYESMSTLPGDYNANGVVDAADYTLWRDSFGRTGTNLDADGNGNGQIDAADLDVWRSHFGETGGAGANQAAAVPEPELASHLAMLVLASALIDLRTSRGAVRFGTL